MATEQGDTSIFLSKRTIPEPKIIFVICKKRVPCNFLLKKKNPESTIIFGIYAKRQDKTHLCRLVTSSWDIISTCREYEIKVYNATTTSNHSVEKQAYSGIVVWGEKASISSLLVKAMRVISEQFFSFSLKEFGITFCKSLCLHSSFFVLQLFSLGDCW